MLCRFRAMQVSSNRLSALRSYPPPRNLATARAAGKAPSTSGSGAVPKATSGLKAEQELLTYRKVTEDLLARQLAFHVRGVSFNQDAASVVQPGQPLLFIREPGNPHDSNAVSVQTLSGETVGYVPRETAPEFVGHYGMVTGHVVSSGKAEQSGLAGVNVSVHPALASLLIDPLPASGAAAASKASSPSSAAAKSALAVSPQACEVTGVPKVKLDAPLALVPVWQYDAHNKVVQLLRVATVCEAVAAAKRLTQLDPGSKEYARAAKLMCDINKWKPEHVQQHVEWVKARQAAMEKDGWTVKV